MDSSALDIGGVRRFCLGPTTFFCLCRDFFLRKHIKFAQRKIVFRFVFLLLSMKPCHYCSSKKKHSALTYANVYNQFFECVSRGKYPESKLSMFHKKMGRLRHLCVAHRLALLLHVEKMLNRQAFFVNQKCDLLPTIVQERKNIEELHQKVVVKIQARSLQYLYRPGGPMFKKSLKTCPFLKK